MTSVERFLRCGPSYLFVCFLRPLPLPPPLLRPPEPSVRHTLLFRLVCTCLPHRSF